LRAVTRYTFGETAQAAERLGVLAEAFDPPSRAFLSRWAPPHASLALDLGCGPGHSTMLVHEASRADRTVGLDRSSPFLEEAGSRPSPGVSFKEHDVLAVPFPTGRADLIYSRLLLAHQREPAEVVRRWSTMLTIGGRLLVDEPEDILTGEAVVRRYLDEVSIPTVRSGGGHLLVGSILGAMQDPAGTSRVHDEVIEFDPPVAVTARIFAMTLSVLVETGEVASRPDLGDGLEAIAAGAPSAPITWRMRQMAFERREA
jgi:SAM-dependent methyltransferase